MRCGRSTLTVLHLALLILLPRAAQESSPWLATWATAAQGSLAPTGAGKKGLVFREVMHVSAGGNAVRITLSNAFGMDPLTIGPISVGNRTSDDQTSEIVQVTFGHKDMVTIPPGGEAKSDSAPLQVAPLTDVAVSFYVPSQRISVLTQHGSNSNNYVVFGGSKDEVMSPTLTSPSGVELWLYVTEIDVAIANSNIAQDSHAGAIVCIGDSITAGYRSSQGKNVRYPDDLAQRLQRSHLNSLGVVNAGIGGNQILHSPMEKPYSNEALPDRFDRDAIKKTGVKYILLLEGINDILHADGNKHDQAAIPPGRSALITDAYTNLAKRAHEAGINLYRNVDTVQPGERV